MQLLFNYLLSKHLKGSHAPRWYLREWVGPTCSGIKLRVLGGASKTILQINPTPIVSIALYNILCNVVRV